MKTVVQRVSRASVRVDGRVVGAIEQGLLILACAVPADTTSIAEQLARKIVHLRIFEDDTGKMNRSVLDIPNDRPRVLVVSQFTLAADVRKGRRPSFINAAAPEHAIPLLDSFCEALVACGATPETGIFGAHMEVDLVNDGPVTIWLDTDDLFGSAARELVR